MADDFKPVGTDGYQPKLGRAVAPDTRHLQRYGLTADTMPEVPTAVGLGTYWYEIMNVPYRDAEGNHWLVPPGSRESDWGHILGGHAYTLNPVGVPYSRRWQLWYEQQRNDCTAYSASIMQSLHNRQKYFAPPVYDHTLTIDEWAGENDEGTSVRATMETLRTRGLWRLKDGQVVGPFLEAGIEVYRWCLSVAQIAYCLHPASRGELVLERGYAIMRQSWGPYYPYSTRVPLDALGYLIFEQPGDATLITDR